MNDKHENHLTICTGYWTDRRHAIQHKGTVGGAILMILLLLLSSSAVLAQSTTATAAVQRTRPFVVMSFNVHGANPNNSSGSNCNPDRIPKDMTKFKELIQKYQATLILVSEIHRRQAYDLAHSLGFPDPYFIATKSPCGIRGRRDLDYGNAIISLYPLRDKRRYSLHTADSDAARDEYTWLAAASIVVNGRRIRAYTTHLTASRFERDRVLQVRDLLRIIPRDEAIAKVGHRALLGQDLNFRPSSAPYNELVTDDPVTDKSGLFIDAWKKRNPFDSGFTEPAANPMQRIDYVLLEKESGFGVVRAVVGDICTSNGICLSDHRPVIVELSFQ